MLGDTESFISKNQSKDIIISNNCCGSNYYRKKNIEYNNPFIWMVVPQNSIKILLTEFDKIDWYNIDMKKSTIRKNTFIIIVDNKIELHFIHHYFDPKHNELFFYKDREGSHLCSNRIWEYIIKKYFERVDLMLKTNMQPKFIIQDQWYGNDKTNMNELIKIPCKYKRIFITSENVNSSDKNCKIIKVKYKEQPEPTINKFFNEIDNFLN